MVTLQTETVGLFCQFGGDVCCRTGEVVLGIFAPAMGMNKLCRDPTVKGDCSTRGELHPLFCDDGGENEGDVDLDNDTSIVAASVSSALNLPTLPRRLLGDAPESLELASSASLSLDFDLSKKNNK